ncbi:hypothetical protein RFN58_35190 [Streptomyces iakyrus]|uniref:hypothetical protein n=1 Tax=Streptomyces iakyrus TaxID=68219 RepID=UPI002E359008|nr:hypothetical protein [Streptomyces iakyrus]
MTAWVVSRSSRSVSRTGAALVVLLAALVHVLACAHGPAPTGAARADAILTASVTRVPPSEPTGDPARWQAAPAEDSPVQCWGTDEPTVQPPRDIAPAADAPQEAQPAVHADASLVSVRGGPPSQPDLGTPPVQRERARLGVWRT